jgi:hypothetical protein
MKNFNYRLSYLARMNLFRARHRDYQLAKYDSIAVTTVSTKVELLITVFILIGASNEHLSTLMSV